MDTIVPAEFNWERDAHGFYTRYHTCFVVAACAYYPMVFGLKHVMKDREPWDLGGAKSHALVNWVFWWEVGLALFSIVGAIVVVPMMLEPIRNGGASWSEAICTSKGAQDDPRSYWVLLFCISKVFEFGDTLFIVLRKKELVVLQHYHHLATMCYCWHCVTTVQRYNNSSGFFAGMNLCVHSVMYSWYAATRTGWRSPKPLMILITMIQLVQMVFGCTIVLVAGFGNASAGCGRWVAEDPTSFGCALFMYASYLGLFAKLFKDNYLTKKKRTKKAA